MVIVTVLVQKIMQLMFLMVKCIDYCPYLNLYMNISIFFWQGGRELDDFIKYIAKEASGELKGWDRKGKAKKTELWAIYM